jgi:hypothetical protein
MVDSWLIEGLHPFEEHLGLADNSVWSVHGDEGREAG